MGNEEENFYERKIIKAKSCNNGPPLKLKGEPTKRKPFNLNEAVMSLDLALGRLKKTKLMSSDCSEYGPPMSPPPSSLGRCGEQPSELFIDLSSLPSVNIDQGIPNGSLMSMNLSHYELMRNLSHSTSNSESAFSGTTCNTCCTDNNLKDERLEKYFRSVEMWNRKCNRDGPSVHFEVSEK